MSPLLAIGVTLLTAGDDVVADLCIDDEVTKLVISDVDHDFFGHSVALADGLTLVGSPGDDPGGAAYLFSQIGSTWEQKLLPDSKGGAFGFAVDLDDDLAAVSAPYDDTRGDKTGIVHVYRKRASWSKVATLTASRPRDQEFFGWSLALDGSSIIVGTRYTVSNPLSGVAYVYQLRAGSWVETAMLGSADGEAGDAFGWDVAISDDLALVGAPADSTQGDAAGAVFAFRFSGVSWLPAGKLLALDGSADDGFGVAVALDGNVAIIGAYRDTPAGTDSGSAYVFRLDGKRWLQEAKLVPSDGEPTAWFGRAVDLEGRLAVVGAPHTDVSGIRSGSAYVYRYDGDTWVEEKKVLASDGSAEDQLGRTLSVSGDVVVAGAPQDSTGSTYVFGGLCEESTESAAASPDDLLALIVGWGECEGCLHDLDGDGCVGVSDLLIVLMSGSSTFE